MNVFETIARAAKSCDIIVGATALQIAPPSVAERMGIPYVFVAYCPTVLPSLHHAPPILTMLGDTSAPAIADYRALWDRDARRWNDMWGVPLNTHRASLGQRAVDDVRSHILTSRPWRRADPTLAPWPDPAEQGVVISSWLRLTLPTRGPGDAEKFFAYHQRVLTTPRRTGCVPDWSLDTAG